MELTVTECRESTVLTSIYIHLVKKVVLQEEQGMFMIWWDYCKTKAFSGLGFWREQHLCNSSEEFFYCSQTPSLNKGEKEVRADPVLLRVHCTTRPRHLIITYFAALETFPSSIFKMLRSFHCTDPTTVYYSLQAKAALFALFWAFCSSLLFVGPVLHLQTVKLPFRASTKLVLHRFYELQL